MTSIRTYPAALRVTLTAHLRHAVHLWADCSRAVCGWAQANYQAERAKGKSHACALRCLGHRWLEVLWKCGRTGRLTTAISTRATNRNTAPGSFKSSRHEAKPV